MGNDEMKRLDGLNEFIEEKMKEWKVPGVAIGIVKDGEVVLTEGFGYRDRDKGLKVTADTVMPIGSSSKAFTSLALGILKDEGKFDWDTPVRGYMPFFSMYDTAVSDKVTARDMLCHRTGLPRHEFSWIRSTFSREQLVKGIRYLQPSKDFRTTFQYQNHMFAAAGYLAEAISKMTWEQFVKERVIDRLGMKDTNFSIMQMQTMENYSKPYTAKDDIVTDEDYMDLETIGPAGSINSTANDMVKYAIMQLGKGKYKDTEIVSEASLNEMHTPQIPAAIYPWNFEEVQMSSYGLGWFIDLYRGYKVVNHGGNTNGFTALVTLVPKENIGIVILTNLNSNLLTYVLSNSIIDRLLGLSDIDWSQRYKAEYDKLVAQSKEEQEETKKNRIPDAPLSHKIEDYTGRFEHPMYGVLSVDYKDGEFKALLNKNELIFKHYHYDIFELIIESEIQYFAKYMLNSKGELDAVSVAFEQAPGMHEILFTKSEKK